MTSVVQPGAPTGDLAAGWWRSAQPRERRALLAAWGGWVLDSFDVMLYALVLPSLMRSLSLDAATAGWIQSLSLVASVPGGFVLGRVADRYGRTRALMASVLLYSVFTAASGFATGALSLAIFRIGLGIGLGGEWASGAALIAETWRARHRQQALAFMQSGWPVGYALAALVSWVLQDLLGLDWRGVFFAGILPALLTLWVRRHVEEPEPWRRASRDAAQVSVREALGGPRLRATLVLVAMSGCVLFGFWGLNTFVPTFLVAPVHQGGVGLERTMMSGLVAANQFGTWTGFLTYGYVAAVFGRKRTCVVYLALAALLLGVYTTVRVPWVLLALGPVASFFTSGYFSSLGVVTTELYPTSVRATAQGLTYNAGRLSSAAAPWLVGVLSQRFGYAAALLVAALAFGVAAVLWVMLPEGPERVDA